MGWVSNDLDPDKMLLLDVFCYLINRSNLIKGDNKMRSTGKKMLVATTALGLMIGSAGIVLAEEAAEDAVASNLKEMFTKGTASGQIRTGWLTLDSDEEGAETLDDWAIGGQLKFETAPLMGISLGAAFYTSHSITQGDEDEFNDEMSSADQKYDLLAESYIMLGYDAFGAVLGRQVIDTPFADSDDIRMTPHTFEALTASYDLDDVGLSFDAGWLTRWQGVDADYPDDADFGDLVEGSDGTAMLGASYANDMLEGGLWWYGIMDVANVFYGDIYAPIPFSEGVELTLGAQFSTQSDDSNAETLEARGAETAGDLYGLMAELSFAGFTVGAAYTHAAVDEGEALFGGFGGGPFFTNIDTLVANEFAAGQDADAYTLSLGYDFSDLGVSGLSIGYVFGQYEGGADPKDPNANADVIEHNIWLEYEFGDGWSMDAVYVMSSDEENDANTEWDYDRAQIRLNYTF